MNNLEKKIFEIKSEVEFCEVALEVFKYQAINNPVYKKYIEYLNKDINKINSVEEIPFLPIEFFKSHKVITGNKEYTKIFTSSGTTGNNTSKHYICAENLYVNSFLQSFEMFYGSIKDYKILALLPSYLEREGSSLIYMVNKLVELSKENGSGFYLYNIDELIENLNKNKDKKTLLFGVSFALLELAEKHKLNLEGSIIMETGGMKGRREEITKEELHSILKKKLGVEAIHSEYGMTELLSQAYSKGDNLFFCPPWMKILIREINDPFYFVSNNQTGGINIIDLANLYSCSFIETKDLGKTHKDDSFEILGRFDNSDIRGCNLLIQ